MRSVRFLAPHTDRRSALWALNGPPIGIALVRDLTYPAACVYVSVRREKYTRFPRSWCCRWKNQDDVPIPARSRDLLSQWMLHTNSTVAFFASHLTDSCRSEITDCGVMLLNCPEQSH